MNCGDLRPWSHKVAHTEKMTRPATVGQILVCILVYTSCRSKIWLTNATVGQILVYILVYNVIYIMSIKNLANKCDHKVRHFCVCVDRQNGFGY